MNFCNLMALLGKPTAHISEDAKRTIRIILFTLVFVVGLFYVCAPVGVHLLIKCITGAALLGLIIIFSVPGDVKKIKLNRWLATLWLLLGLLQLISGLLVSIEFLPMAMIFLVGYPLLFVVWGARKDYKELFLEVAKAGNLCLIFFIVVSVLAFPSVDGNYTGMTGNPNSLGQWMTFGLPLIFICYDHQKNRGLRNIIYGVEIAVLYMLLVLARGRTALLAAAIETVVFLILWFISDGVSMKNMLKRIGCFLCCAIVAVPLAWLLNQNVAPSIHSAVQTQIQAMNNQGDAAGDALEGDEDGLPAEEDGLTAETVIDGLITRVTGKDKESGMLDDYSSGRTVIWRETLRNLNAIGHPSREHILTDRNGDVGNNTHNTVLQFAYDNGVFAGVVYGLLLVSGAVCALRLVHRKGEAAILSRWCICIHAGYFVTAMLASINLPFLYLIAFLYYLTYAPLLDGDLRYAE